ALAYNAVLASGVAWLLWTFIVARLPASVAGISSLAIPIVGVGLAWVLLGERPSPAEGLGILLLCAALAVVSLRRARGSGSTGRRPDRRGRRSGARRRACRPAARARQAPPRMRWPTRVRPPA